MALVSVKDNILAAAEANVAAAVEQFGGQFTEQEKRAMLVVDELKQVNGMDLMAILLRGEYITQIEQEGLVGLHPGGFGDMQTLARAQGVSPSEMSDTKAMYQTIFPYLQRLGFSVALVWDDIGVSNFREMTAVLKAVITGETPNRRTTRESLRVILNHVIDENGPALTTTDDELKETTVRWLIGQATELNNDRLRDLLRPWNAQITEEPSEPEEPTMIDVDMDGNVTTVREHTRGNNGHRGPSAWIDVIDTGVCRYVLAQLTYTEYNELMLALPAMAARIHTLPDGTPARREEAARIPILRTLAHLLED